MPTTHEAFVTPEVLRWARKRAHLTQEQLAKKINGNPATLSLWEKGDKRPTFRQAEALARKLQIPFGYLFLSTHPEDDPVPLPDFRTIKNAEFFSPTANFLDLLHEALAKQSWYKDLLKLEEAETLPFVGKFNVSDDPQAIAADIAATVKINDEARSKAQNWSDFLTRVIKTTENAQILVMRNSIVAGNTHRGVSPGEFRGFAVSDKLAPLVYINSSDSRAAQIFTLVHELAHLWIGQTGISNEPVAEIISNNTIENKCNQIATEVLVPRQRFIEIWSQASNLAEQISRAVRFFRISSLVVLRRTLELKLLSADVMWAYYRQEEKKHLPSSNEGGDYFRNVVNRNSSLLTRAVIDTVRSEQILYTEAGQLLNVSPSMIPKVAKFLVTDASP